MTQTPEHAQIRVADASKRFGNDVVLNNISLKIEQGETVVLIGSSGCGKSSLLRCLCALESIDSGTISVNGHPLHEPSTNLHEFRSRIGMVFQQFNLFPHLSVLENLILGPTKVNQTPKSEAIQTANELLERIDILDKAHEHPDKLSGGQQQRVAIARSLAMNPDIMLYDEPTSALDPRMTYEVLGLIHDVAKKGMTTLIVTHELDFARRVADRILFMHEGSILESGSPSQLLDTPQHKVTREYLQAFAL